jgi:hypothetical protein
MFLIKKQNLYSIVYPIVSMVEAQTKFQFASGEGQRVYDLLDGLGCIGNSQCTLFGDFKPTTACSYQPNFLKCDDNGRLAHL